MKIFLVSLALVAIACASSISVEEQQSAGDGDSAAEPSTGSFLAFLLRSQLKLVIKSVVEFVQQRKLLPAISSATEKFQEFLQGFQAKIESCEGSLNPKCNLTKAMTQQISRTLTTKLEAFAVEYEPIIEYLEGAAKSYVQAFEDFDEKEFSDLKARVMDWARNL